jgi:hypothetical protein
MIFISFYIKAKHIINRSLSSLKGYCRRYVSISSLRFERRTKSYCTTRSGERGWSN